MNNAKIWADINKLGKYLENLREYQKFPFKVICTSGAMDGIHLGHVSCMQAARRLGDSLVVIVNGNGFLERKKGYYVIDLEERMKIVSAIKGVDHVVPWDDGSQFVHGALEIIRPNIFAKGGSDRSCPEQMAKSELEICKKIGCLIEYGVGGFDKLNSSSWMARKIQEKALN